MAQESTTHGTRVRMQWGLQIPLRDGVHLTATAYLPECQKEPAPVIFILTPYIAQSFHERGVYFAEQGYPFIAVDVRGRGNSQGDFKCYNKTAEDAYDIVEWLARQSYCNGKVAMWGGSYQGYVQWAAASVSPPHLTTIVPVASPHCGIDAPMRNNIFGPYTLQWLYLIAGHALQDRVFADQLFWTRQFRRWFESGSSFRQLDTFLGYPSSQFQEWLSHPHLDRYWDRLNPTAEQYSRISIPILTITGVYDGDQAGALMHYREHVRSNPHARHCLVIGPWNHAGTRTPQAQFCGIKVGRAGLIDLSKLHAEWYGWTMQNGPKPAFLLKDVAYYVMGADRWRYADTLDEVTGRLQPFHLSSMNNPTDVFHAGLLTPEPLLASGPDHYVYDPCDVSLAALESTIDIDDRVDQRMIHASLGKQLIYHSMPFEQDTEISGFFRLSAWLSIDQPDTDFQVSIHEISVDGTSIQLTTDVLRARYRESFREERLVHTTEPLRYDFNHFMFTSRLICKGNRLRLIIGPINSIYSQRNYNSGGGVADESRRDARTVTVKLFHDESHTSVLHVPFGQPDLH